MKRLRLALGLAVLGLALSVPAAYGRENLVERSCRIAMVLEAYARTHRGRAVGRELSRGVERALGALPVLHFDEKGRARGEYRPKSRTQEKTEIRVTLDPGLAGSEIATLILEHERQHAILELEVPELSAYLDRVTEQLRELTPEEVKAVANVRHIEERIAMGAEWEILHAMTARKRSRLRERAERLVTVTDERGWLRRILRTSGLSLDEFLREETSAGRYSTASIEAKIWERIEILCR